MKTSPASTLFLATFALLSASTLASGQQLQRSMVYHAAPQQAAPQVSHNAQASAAKPSQNKQQTSDHRQVATLVSIDKQPRVAINLKASYVSPKDTAARAASTRPTTIPTTSTSIVTKTAIAESSARVDSHASSRAEASASVKRIDKKSAPAFGKKLDNWFYLSSAVFAAGAILDHTSTSAGMKKAGAREANPLLRNADGGFSPGKHLALTAGIYGASFMLQKNHPRMANALRLISGFAKIGVSIHNRSVTSGRPDALPR